MAHPFPALLLKDVGRILRADPGETPRRFLLTSYTVSLFKEAVAVLPAQLSSPPHVVIAYSIKTNPLPELLDLARDMGMWAEAITQCEVAHAINHGIVPEHTILNGPGKWWPDHRIKVAAYGAIFCDSLQELRRLSKLVASRKLVTRCLGIRLRPATVNSRFGIDLSDPRVFSEVVRALKQLPRRQGIGFHFHMASSMVGVKTWRYLAETFITAVELMIDHVGPRPTTISFGGGWHPDDWTGFLRKDFPALVAACRRRLPSVERIILEPGKALSQRSMCLLTRVLEVRRSRWRTEMVVDGSVAELPDVRSHPHRIVSRTSAGKVGLWKPGSDRILGRLCMEFDILADAVRIPRHIKDGDLVGFLDAGAYDASMAYHFSRGFVATLSHV